MNMPYFPDLRGDTFPDLRAAPVLYRKFMYSFTQKSYSCTSRDTTSRDTYVELSISAGHRPGKLLEQLLMLILS